MGVVGPGPGSTLDLAGRRTLLNPGSVGQPRDGDPRASYLVLDPDAGTVSWQRVAYDIRSVQDAIRAAGLPDASPTGSGSGRDEPRRDSGVITRRAPRSSAMIGGRRPLQGRKPGDKRVVVERPHAPYFRYTAPGQMTAKEAASIPTTPGARLMARARGILLGRPLTSESEIGERLTKTKALAIFSSDAISSSRLRDRGDHPRVPPRRSGPRGPAVVPADRHRHRRPAGDRRVQLSPGLHRLSDRRRLVLGLEAELRADGVARRRLGAAHRLQPDRRRVDLVGRGTDRVGVPGAQRRSGSRSASGRSC